MHKKMHKVLSIVEKNTSKKVSHFTLQVSDFTLRALVWFEVKFQTYG